MLGDTHISIFAKTSLFLINLQVRVSRTLIKCNFNHSYYLPGFCLKCYLCNPYPSISAGRSFTPQQCEKNQTELTCVPPYDRCIKAHQKKKNKDGSKIEHELRSCANGQVCDTYKSSFEQAELMGWINGLACCHTDLCNAGFRNVPNELWVFAIAIFWALFGI